jgi:hypothetical protein
LTHVYRGPHKNIPALNEGTTPEAAGSQHQVALVHGLVVGAPTYPPSQSGRGSG